MGARIELNSGGMRQLLNDPGVAAKCLSEARRVAKMAGAHFDAEGPYCPGSRALALVVPHDGKGAYLEATEKTLTKAVSACKS